MAGNCASVLPLRWFINEDAADLALELIPGHGLLRCIEKVNEAIRLDTLHLFEAFGAQLETMFRVDREARLQIQVDNMWVYSKAYAHVANVDLQRLVLKHSKSEVRAVAVLFRLLVDSNVENLPNSLRKVEFSAKMNTQIETYLRLSTQAELQNLTFKPRDRRLDTSKAMFEALHARAVRLRVPSRQIAASTTAWAAADAVDRTIAIAAFEAWAGLEDSDFCRQLDAVGNFYPDEPV